MGGAGGEAAPFGERLRRLRQAAGLTQQELAERAGLTAKGIAALERGRVRRPYPHTLRALADALGLSPQERAALVAAGTPAPARPADAPPGDPLLRTKLHLPPARPDLVPRPRLLARLAAGLRGPLTLVAAPAGSGKTTLLSAWRAAPPGSETPLAWLSLDEHDNDPARFWRYVVAALDQLQPGIADDALALLRSPQPPVETLLTVLLNALAALPRDAVLALDDYHAIEAPPIHRGLAFLLDHRPPRLHLVLAGRADPPLPLGRLRARGALAEIRAADLRFTVEEAAAFLREAMGLDLAAAEVAALEARTEGWIAGLQLAALALQGQAAGRRADLITDFTGSHRYVVDYLAEEVLGRQPPERQRFLLQTAVLDRLSGPLCDAVTGGDDGQATLEALERAHLFVVPLDGERRWYRYHHLFADVLRQQLRRTEPARLPLLHRRASAWFEEHGPEAEAVRHALAAADGERAADLVERWGQAVAVRGEFHTVLGWLGALPEALVRSRPTLCIYHAGVLMLANQRAAAEARLRDAERGLRPDTPAEQARSIQGRVAEIRASLARLVGDHARMLALARRALALLPETERAFRASATAHVARACLLSGDATPEAERLVEGIIAPARASGNVFAVVSAFTNLARVRVLQGRLRAAAATYREVAGLVTGPPALPVPSYAFGLGDLLRERDDLAAAEHHLTRGMELIGGTIGTDAEWATLGYLALARVRQARGDHTGALGTLEQFAEFARERGFVGELVARGAALRAQLQLAQGDLAAATRWAEASGRRADDEPSYPREAEYLALARVLIARGRLEPAGEDLDAARRLLHRLLAAAEAAGRLGSALEVRVLRALANEAGGERCAALADLTRALALAAPEGYVRVFVDEGRPLACLLTAWREGHREPRPPALVEYSARLLAACAPAEQEDTPPPPAATDQPLPEPLTPRELEVLRLLAAGHANAAIAARLHVAVSTVKTHVNALFGKLGATSRTQAVARARALGLLRD